MSHAGRRIASTAAAAAAVALPIAAAGSAHAASLPLVGALPAVGALTESPTAGLLSQAVPVSGLPSVGNLTGSGLPGIASLTGNGGASPLAGLPVLGGLSQSMGNNLQLLNGSSGASAAQTAALPGDAPETVPMQPASHQANTAQPLVPHAIPAQRITTDAQAFAMHYLGKHKKS